MGDEAIGELRRFPPFSVDVSCDDHRAVVMVHGDIDIETAPIIVRQVREVLAERVASVAVDLGNVSFMDGAGVAALVGSQAEAGALGIPFYIGAVTRPARLVLDPTDLSATFELRPTSAGGLA